MDNAKVDLSTWHNSKHNFFGVSAQMLYLDKQKTANASGETKEFEVAEGSQVLQAKIDWCTSNPLNFTIVENEIKEFELSSFAKHNPLGTLAAIYYISIGKNNYLNLKAKNG